jgi:hypothetical protein
MDRKKVYTGIGLICAAVLMMLIGQNISSPFLQISWVILLGAGLLLYLWGRFFSRDNA